MRRSIFLSGFMRHSNPWQKGIRPKKFLFGRVKMMKDEMKVNDKRVYNPNWTKQAA